MCNWGKNIGKQIYIPHLLTVLLTIRLNKLPWGWSCIVVCFFGQKFGIVSSAKNLDVIRASIPYCHCSNLVIVVSLHHPCDQKPNVFVLIFVVVLIQEGDSLCGNYLSLWWVAFKSDFFTCLQKVSDNFIFFAEINQTILKIYFIPIAFS